MSDIHIVADGSTGLWRLVFHFPVPDVDNNVGVNYRTALVNSQIGLREDLFNPGTFRRTILPSGTEAGQINPAEEALLDSGQLFERSLIYPLESGGTTGPQLVTTVDDLYANTLVSVQTQISNRLRYFGLTRNVA